MVELRCVIAKALEAKLQQRRRDGEYVFDWNEMAATTLSALAAAGIKCLGREPTVAQVEAVRRAMSPEKFVSHMRAIDCWTEGWLAAEPSMPSELALVGEVSKSKG